MSKSPLLITIAKNFDHILCSFTQCKCVVDLKVIIFFRKLLYLLNNSEDDKDRRYGGFDRSRHERNLISELSVMEITGNNLTNLNYSNRKQVI